MPTLPPLAHIAESDAEIPAFAQAPHIVAEETHADPPVEEKETVEQPPPVEEMKTTTGEGAASETSEIDCEGCADCVRPTTDHPFRTPC